MKTYQKWSMTEDAKKENEDGGFELMIIKKFDGVYREALPTISTCAVASRQQNFCVYFSSLCFSTLWTVVRRNPGKRVPKGFFDKVCVLISAP